MLYMAVQVWSCEAVTSCHSLSRFHRRYLSSSRITLCCIMWYSEFANHFIFCILYSFHLVLIINKITISIYIVAFWYISSSMNVSCWHALGAVLFVVFTYPQLIKLKHKYSWFFLTQPYSYPKNEGPPPLFSGQPPPVLYDKYLKTIAWHVLKRR